MIPIDSALAKESNGEHASKAKKDGSSQESSTAGKAKSKPSASQDAPMENNDEYEYHALFLVVEQVFSIF